MFEFLRRWSAACREPFHPGPADLGRRGEARALRFYRVRGFQRLAANLRTEGGEIDLVMRRGRLLVFVEVKARQTATHGAPHEAVDARKQLRITKIAQSFLSQHRIAGQEVRFDVLSLFWNGRRFQIKHFPDAFRPVASPELPWRWRNR